MSRSRKVEPEAALDAAQALFWKHGFGQVGTRQIEEETGLTRFTLQTSYGGKKSLFLQTLDAYLTGFETDFISGITAGGLESIANWFELRASSACLPEVTACGCLMLNTIVEFQGQDDEVNHRSGRFMKALRGSFISALESAKEDGLVDPNFDVDAKAELLLGIAISLNVIIRGAEDNSAGAKMAASVATMIRDWRVKS